MSNHDEPALSASMDQSLSHHQLFLYGPEPQPSAALSASMDRNLSHQQLLASPSLWFCQLLYHIEENLTNSRSRLLCQLSNNGFSLLFSVCEHPQSITGTQRTAFLTPQTRAGTYGHLQAASFLKWISLENRGNNVVKKAPSAILRLLPVKFILACSSLHPPHSCHADNLFLTLSPSVKNSRN